MDISFDYETNQKVIKLNADEEGLLISALNTADWYTHIQGIADFCNTLRSELKNDRN